jgi:uncharacterized iron-regulated membrane protein
MTKGMRALFFRVHSWLGAQLFFILFLIISTGTLATVSNEIDWLTKPQMRAPHAERPVSWQTMHDAVRAAYPDHDIDSLNAPVGPGFAAEVLTTRPDGGYLRVYVDPGTGRVQGSHGWVTVQRFLRNLHMNMNLPGFGILFVCSFAVVLLVSLISGLITYKRFWRGFARRPRTGDPRRLMGDLHRLGGLWSLWFVALIAATGIWYLIEDAVDYRWERKAPIIAPPVLAASEPVRLISVDEAVSAVRNAWPDFRISYINLSDSLTQPVTVGGQGSAWLVRPRGNLIYLHPRTGKVLRIKNATRVPGIERWIDTADPLHFGDFGGLATKLIWFSFGVILSFLSFSGFWLMLKRTRRPVAPAPQIASNPSFDTRQPCAAE